MEKAGILSLPGSHSKCLAERDKVNNDQPSSLTENASLTTHPLGQSRQVQRQAWT